MPHILILGWVQIAAYFLFLELPRIRVQDVPLTLLTRLPEGPNSTEMLPFILDSSSHPIPPSQNADVFPSTKTFNRFPVRGIQIYVESVR